MEQRLCVARCRDVAPSDRRLAGGAAGRAGVGVGGRARLEPMGGVSRALSGRLQSPWVGGGGAVCTAALQLVNGEDNQLSPRLYCPILPLHRGRSAYVWTEPTIIHTLGSVMPCEKFRELVTF